MTNGYRTALEEARRELAQKNTMDMARLSGAALSLYPPLSWREFTVPFLGRVYQIPWPTGEVFLYANRKKASEGVSLILLQYLINSTGNPPAGKWISFNHLWGGNSYFPAFAKRALEPLAEYFGNREKLLARLLQQMLHARPGKEPGSYLVIALPKLPLYLRIDQGDQEVPARASILFDQTANEYLPTEVLATVGEALTGRLLRWGRAAVK
ncbi:MAG TPA: DUF3786 domain-containing protein [Firmicutes bacterium]|nr:DUF3786 domain-containing protein [Bacillota bacterium]